MNEKNEEHTLDERSVERLKVRLSALLKHKRADLHFTLGDLSKEAGLSASYLAGIEKGKRSPSYEAILKICRGLKISPQTVFTPSHEQNDDTRLLDLFLADAFAPDKFHLPKYEEARRELLSITTSYPLLSAAFLTAFLSAFPGLDGPMAVTAFAATAPDVVFGKRAWRFFPLRITLMGFSTFTAEDGTKALRVGVGSA